MDDHRAADALTDAALDREIEAALAVDPSPEFVARVRTRVQTARNASWSALPWGFAAAAGAIVVMIAVVGGMSRPNRSQVVKDAPVTQEAPVARHPSTARPEPFDSPLILSPPAPALVGGGSKDEQFAQDRPAEGRAPRAGFSPAPKTTPRKAVAPSTRRVPRNEPQMLIAADEARALRRLFADVRKGLIDLSSLQEVAPATAALQPPSEIAFAPIVFEPIAPETAEEGERQ